MPENPAPKRKLHPWRDVPSSDVGPARESPPARAYVELEVTSNFTFLTGASHPEELVERARDLGHAAAAIADHNSLAGVVRAHVAAKALGVALVVGCRLVLEDGTPRPVPREGALLRPPPSTSSSSPPIARPTGGSRDC